MDLTAKIHIVLRGTHEGLKTDFLIMKFTVQTLQTKHLVLATETRSDVPGACTSLFMNGGEKGGEKGREKDGEIGTKRDKYNHVCMRNNSNNIIYNVIVKYA